MEELGFILSLTRYNTLHCRERCAADNSRVPRVARNDKSVNGGWGRCGKTRHSSGFSGAANFEHGANELNEQH